MVLSMEVSNGVLATSLPSELVASTEVKMKSSYQWQPLQTFVTISKHFMVRAKGIRFRGAIEECNNILQQLSYHVSEFVRKCKASGPRERGLVALRVPLATT